MAQQGGTYRSTQEEKPSIKERSSPNPPTQSRCDERKRSEEDWEIVKNPKDEPPERQIRGFHSSFDLQLGWGKWKFSALSWEVNAGSQQCDHHQRQDTGRNSVADGGREDDSGKR
ncbi:hypothetical protein CABS01_09138 [Colletotrichum abscissum]|uniref:uncharacterized protein n=1 Tax=Colletotrichum abscissum TaxID=1671311 RepID=UPI0027D49CA3|nr:uncharacterized protein CABS01_09138 [Colletotrichum abscissum]KAK1503749.1 hypothetical protein CABS01_09138 [Colletotrichum abscissum]